MKWESKIMENQTESLPRIADKQALRQTLHEVYTALGIVPDPTATAQKSRELMLQDGVCPEENVFSRAIIAARDK